MIYEWDKVQDHFKDQILETQAKVIQKKKHFENKEEAIEQLKKDRAEGLPRFKFVAIEEY